MKKTLLFLLAFGAFQTSNAQLYINEILVSPPGSDSPNEYIELRGTPNSTIAADTYLIQIEGDGESNPGDVESNSDSSNGCFINNDGVTPCPQGGIIDLSGITLGNNGVLVILKTGHPYTVNSDAVILLDVTDGELEDQSHTFLLVNTNGNGAPSSNDDIDADDDGEIDVAYTSIWTFMDGIAFVDDDGIGSNDEFAYANVIFAEEAFNPANSPSNSLNAPSTATIIYTPSQYDYAARIGNSTGDAITNDETTSDWVGGDLPSNDPSMQNWTISTTPENAYPNSFAGSELNHIGSQNPSGNTLSVSQFGQSATLTIFPNPAVNNVTIKSQSEITSVELYNVLGVKMVSVTALVNDTLDISTYSAGVYLLKVNMDGKTITKRMIIK